MIEILDKINNTYEKLKELPEVLIHPLRGDTTIVKDIDEYPGHEITGVIYKEDGSTLILYKKRG